MKPEQFRAIFPAADAAVWAPILTDMWQRYGFVTKEAQAGCLGIMGNETGGFTNVRVEYTGWTAAQMMSLFGLSASQAADLAAQSPETRANYCYAHSNGNNAPGDGFRYRGRGIIQLTGRRNYRLAGQALGIDLEGNPDLAFEPKTAANVAGWYMTKAMPQILPKLNAISEASFLEGAMMVGKTKGEATQRRLNYRAKALSVLNAAPSPPRVPAAVLPAAAGSAPLVTARAAPWWWAFVLKLLGRA